MENLDLVQQAINEKLFVRQKGASASSVPPAAAKQPALSSSSIRQLTPQDSRPLWSSPKVQIFAVCGTFIILAFVVKQLFFGGGNAKTVADPITPVKAEAPPDCTQPAFSNTLACVDHKNAVLEAKDGVNQAPQMYVKDKDKPKVPPKGSVSQVNIPRRQQLPVIYAQQPQQVFRPTPIPQSFPPSTPIVRQPQYVRSYSSPASLKPKTDPESLWRTLSTDGVTVVAGNSGFVPTTSATDVSFVSDVQPVTVPSNNAYTPVAFNAPDTGSQSQPIQSGEGKLLEPIVWAGDFDVSGQEFPIKVTEPVGNVPTGSIIYAQLDSVKSSGSGLVSLRATRSDRGDVSGIKITATSGAPLQAKVKGRGGGNFWSTAGRILLGGVQVAANQSLRSSDDVLGSVGAGVASNALSNVSSGLGQGNRNVQQYFEISKGTTVKLTVF
jgi:hypothetical protein